jgi:AraC-like DNA-binding protein
VEFRPGYASLGFLGHAHGHFEYSSGEEIELCSIWVSPCVFDECCRAVSGTGGWGFHAVLQGDYHNCDFKNDAREESILNRLEMSATSGSDRLNRLLLESQILELLSINIERLFCGGFRDDRPTGLSKADMERLTLAREILLSRLESPPSLLELSRMIQMNDCTLKRTFKRRFGKTVYEFVREQRLEKAFFLLQDGHHNVSQSACAVGYTNVSHFSEAFQKRFGVSPRALVRATSG